VICFTAVLLIKAIICSGSALAVKKFLTVNSEKKQNKIILSVFLAVLFCLVVFITVTEQNVIREFF
jgi:hypothetical protein